LSRAARSGTLCAIQEGEDDVAGYNPGIRQAAG
jgi:hypothetical protein